MQNVPGRLAARAAGSQREPESPQPGDLMAKGIDFAFYPHPTIAQLQSRGVQFVGRYLAAEAPLGGSNGKIISVAEKNEILGAGLALVLFHEWDANAMLGGYPAGVAAAHSDDQQLAQLGMTGCPVYNVADFDALPSQQAAINAYQDGYASVRGWPVTGLYGGYWVVSRARAAGKATYTCGTPAWSGNNWGTCGWKPTIMQGASFMIGSASCDWDIATTADFGQWPRPAVPKGAGMIITTPPPGDWEGTVITIGKGVDGNIYITTTSTGTAWSATVKQ